MMTLMLNHSKIDMDVKKIEFDFLPETVFISPIIEPGIFKDLKKLETIVLSRFRIIEINKDLFQNLASLKELDLSCNSIVK